MSRNIKADRCKGYKQDFPKNRYLWIVLADCLDGTALQRTSKTYRAPAVPADDERYVSSDCSCTFLYYGLSLSISWNWTSVSIHILFVVAVFSVILGCVLRCIAPVTYHLLQFAIYFVCTRYYERWVFDFMLDIAHDVQFVCDTTLSLERHVEPECQSCKGTAMFP